MKGGSQQFELNMNPDMMQPQMVQQMQQMQQPQMQQPQMPQLTQQQINSVLERYGPGYNGPVEIEGGAKKKKKH